jgi:hypothetical protein
VDIWQKENIEEYEKIFEEEQGKLKIWWTIKNLGFTALVKTRVRIWNEYLENTYLAQK